MRKTFLGGLLALTLALPLAAPLAAQTVTIDTAIGPVPLAANPQKIAVFDIAALDTLAALGIDVAGVTDKVYLPSLAPVAAQAQVIGTLFEPDFEALVVMQPDLIIAGGRSSTQVAALSDIAPTIDMTIWGAGLLDQARARIAAYGLLFSAQEAAQGLTETLEAKIAAARAAVAGKGNVLILLTNGGKISAYGSQSRFGWLHTEIGLPEAVAGLDDETHGQSVSFEFVAEADPDWLVVVDRGAAIGAQAEAAVATLDNPLIARTAAAQNGRIIYLDATPLYIAGGGANAVMQTLDEIIAAFAAEVEG